MSTGDSVNITDAGYVSYNGSGTFNNRTITGTANEISVSNGDGTAGNTNLSLPSTIYVDGISFDSGTNLLEDYVGATSWTPVAEGQTSTGTASYDEQSGTYGRIGRVVFARFALRWTSHTGTGNLAISGIPINAFTDDIIMWGGNCEMGDITFPTGTNQIKLVNAPSATNRILVRSCGDNAAWANVQIEAAGTLRGSVIYIVA